MPSTIAIAKPTSVSVSVIRTSVQKPFAWTRSRMPPTTSSGWGSTNGETSKIAMTSFQMMISTTIETDRADPRHQLAHARAHSLTPP